MAVEEEKKDTEDIGTEDTVTDDVQDKKTNENADVNAQGNPEENADAEAESDEGAVSEKKEKKDKKDKKSKKDKKDSRDIKIEELNDRLMRLMAEYENYRKRTDREKSTMYEMGAKSVVEKIIPVIDNFERGFATVSDEQKEDPFVQGMDKVYKQMTDSLKEAGLKAIEAVGQEFDPNIHEAVMHVEDESAGENVVVEELQKGYMYRDTLVRCSMVKVAN